MFTSLSFAFGKMGITAQRCMTNQQINSVVVGAEHDFKFVYYLLRAYEAIIFSFNSGIDTPIVPKSVFESIQVSVPASRIAERKIAAILSAYDDLIANNQRRIALLESMAEEIYREWFVRMRFPGHKKAGFVKGVPARWKVLSFREVVEYYIGGGWGEELPTVSSSEGAFVVRGTDVPKLNGGKLLAGVYRYHSPQNLRSRRLRDGDFVFEVSGGSKDQLLGRSLLVTDQLLGHFGNEVICASFCKLIRFNAEIASPYFMKYYLKLYYDSGLVGLFQVQSTGISNYQFESFLSRQTILIPTRELRDAFDAQVQPLVAMKDTLAEQVLALETTRDALLPRLISGKLKLDHLAVQFPPSMREKVTA